MLFVQRVIGFVATPYKYDKSKQTLNSQLGSSWMEFLKFINIL